MRQFYSGVCLRFGNIFTVNSRIFFLSMGFILSLSFRISNQEQGLCRSVSPTFGSGEPRMDSSHLPDSHAANRWLIRKILKKLIIALPWPSRRTRQARRHRRLLICIPTHIKYQPPSPLFVSNIFSPGHTNRKYNHSSIRELLYAFGTIHETHILFNKTEQQFF